MKPLDTTNMIGNFGAFNISLALRAATLGSMAISGLLLAKLMPPEQYGVYGHALALVSLAAIIGSAGTETFLMREVGAAGGQSMDRVLKQRLVGHGLRLAVIASILVTISLLGALELAGERGAGHISGHGLVVLVAMVPLLSLIAVMKGLAKGERRYVAAQLPDGVLRPWLLIGAILIAHTLSARIDAILAITLYGASLFVALLVLLQVSHVDMRRMFRPEPERKTWTRACLALLLVSAVMVFNRRLDVLMLGFMVDESATGGYVLATRVADGLTVFFTAFSISFAAKCAHWLRAGALDELQSNLRRATRLVFFVTSFIGLLLILTSNVLLQWFNPVYIDANSALELLIVAQVVNTGFGLSGLLLVLSDDQTWYSRLLAIGAVANTVLNAWLIPQWGMVGAAFATLLVTLGWNLSAWLRLRKRIGVDSSIRGFRPHHAQG